MKPSNMSFVELNSCITSGTPGANIDDASGVMNVRAETSVTVPHFFEAFQFCCAVRKDGH